MTTYTITTTDAEDAAIMAFISAALEPNQESNTVTGFLENAVRHQINFAVTQSLGKRLDDAGKLYLKAKPEDQAAIDAILAKVAAEDAADNVKK